MMSFFDACSTLKYLWQHPLNGANKFCAILSFAKWQLGTKILNKPVIIHWIDNCLFIAEKGDRGITGNIYAGLMEPEEMLFLTHTLKPNWCFIDVGSNVGVYTLLASKVIGAETIAFEPIPHTAEKLRRQISLNCIENKVKVLMAAVSDKSGRIYFTDENSTTNHISPQGKVRNTIEVDAVTLDETIDNTSDSIFLKIDVEGFEYLALKGAINLLKSGRVKALIIELCGSGIEFGYSDMSIHELLTQLGYKPIKYNFNTKEISPLQSYRKDAPNTIYVRSFIDISAIIKLSNVHTLHTPKKITI